MCQLDEADLALLHERHSVAVLQLAGSLCPGEPRWRAVALKPLRQAHTVVAHQQLLMREKRIST